MTYILSNGVSQDVIHGTLLLNSGNRNGILNFEEDEWITKVDISSGESLPQHKACADYLEITTIDSKGSIRLHGPFGYLDEADNATTLCGVVYRFFGCSGSHINALGFHI